VCGPILPGSQEVGQDRAQVLQLSDDASYVTGAVLDVAGGL
jgi:hypothetical protein